MKNSSIAPTASATIEAEGWASPEECTLPEPQYSPEMEALMGHGHPCTWGHTFYAVWWPEGKTRSEPRLCLFPSAEHRAAWIADAVSTRQVISAGHSLARQFRRAEWWATGDEVFRSDDTHLTVCAFETPLPFYVADFGAHTL